MLVEHSFITTLESSSCFDRIHALMQHLKYRGRDLSHSELVFEKGHAKVAKYSSLFELPQQIAIRFDRGKVNVAAAMQTFRDKVSPQHSRFLIALANAVEQQVTQQDESRRVPAVSALIEEINQLNESYKREVDKKKRSSRWLAAGLVIFILAIFSFVIYVAVAW